MWWGVGALGAVLYFTLLFVLGLSCLRKGHWVMFVLGIFLLDGLMVAAYRLRRRRSLFEHRSDHVLACRAGQPADADAKHRMLDGGGKARAPEPQALARGFVRTGGAGALP